MDARTQWLAQRANWTTDTAKVVGLTEILHHAGLLAQSESDSVKALLHSRPATLVSILRVFEFNDDLEDLEENLRLLTRESAAIDNSQSSFGAAPQTTTAMPLQSITSFFAQPAPTTVSWGDQGDDDGLSRYIQDPGWREALRGEFEKPYFKQIEAFLQAQRASNVTYYPPDKDIFAALNSTPLDKVTVVILGQDPYFNPDQAHGLCFSVQRGTAVPPSLNTIYKELAQEYPGFRPPKHGCLDAWAQSGVLMLNATLTVERGKANSHANCGWQTFTDAIIRVLNERCSGLVYLLWGGFAQKKGKLVDQQRHQVLEAAHPSPLAGGAFLGCGHFVKTNQLLAQLHKPPVGWTDL